MFKNKIALITGAASGIGKALAQKAVTNGMHVVLADIDISKLSALQQELSELSTSPTPPKLTIVPMDVTNKDDWQKLLQITLELFNQIDFFFNNAGMGGPTGKLWTIAPTHIQRLLDVNLLGILHGIQTFVPQLLKQTTESHIVITAALSGFFTYPYFSAYQVSKHAVMVLAECLYHELSEACDHITVSVLCPGFVQTEIFNKALQTQMDDVTDITLLKPIKDLYKRVKYGMPSSKIAELTFKGIREKKFYIVTHPNMLKDVQARFEAILENKKPAKFDIAEEA